MNHRREEFLGRRGRRVSTLVRRDSYQAVNSDDDSDYSRCPSPLLALDSGYRVDPFLQYPVARASRGVRFMADYYIQVWAPQQASASTLVNGRNALLALVLPLTLQNAMLFEATIAMTRAAWVIRQGNQPLSDKMMLRHRGSAMEELRKSLTGPDYRVSDYVLLTMSTLLTMNYMVNDIEAFEVHLRALERMIRNSSTDDDSETLSFVRGRVLAFGILASFLQAQQPSYATRINDSGHRISTLTYPAHPFSPDLCEIISRLPPGFAEVALGQSIAIELISFLVKLTELIKWLTLPRDQRLYLSQPGLTMQRAIYDLQCMSALPLTPFEAQILRALLAFCLHVYNETSFRIPLARPLHPILESFNEHMEIPRHPWLQRCLLWCSIVTASAWDTQIDASPRTHVVLERTLQRTAEGRDWEDTKHAMQSFFWVEALQDEWEITWRAASFKIFSRQRRGASHASSMEQLLLEGSPHSESRSSNEPKLDSR